MRTSDGVEIAVIEFGGTGRPIVLLHGLMSCAESWRPRAAQLTPYGRVLAPDARAHGGSQRGADLSPHRLAADVVELLERTGPAALVGHSMGGITALLAAAARPDLVTALVVEDSPLDLTGTPADHAADMRAWFTALAGPHESTERVAEVFAGDRPEVGDHMARCVVQRDDGWWLATDIDDAMAVSEHWRHTSLLGEACTVRAPLLVIEAGDSVVPPGQLELLASRVPDARHIRLPGTGHLVHDAVPKTWAQEVIALLERTG
ncbi:alpha/beta fold hydrolase [Pseudonocardia phyllosphaerae]|uniref:alpha/beta fold hydrolase n=1 Tax=Pseudonocardia phyllosphaerae TaxID=3390502 RepID=UPI00397E31E6